MGDPAKALVKEENILVPKEIPKGYVLVKVQAAALNPVYVQLRPSDTLDRVLAPT